MKKNILIASGGSGGHIIPAIAFHDHLKKKFNLFISSDLRGLNYIDPKNYNLITIATPNVFNNFFLIPFKLIYVLILTIKSIVFLKNKKINIVLSMGGYPPTPLCLASISLGIKFYIYEPNLVIGRSNKFFLRYCTKIFCYKKKIRNFPNKYKKKIFLLNPLVRKIFYKSKPKKNKRFRLMIIGGSQGAKIFDEYLHKIISKISKKKQLEIFHQTKNKNIKYLKAFYNKNKIKNKVFDFDKRIIDLIKGCDFCITRAGASTLAELFILKIPFLAIPLPSAKDNHQYENARYYKDKNCSWVLDEKKINENILQKLLNDIILKKNDFLKKKKFTNNSNEIIRWKNQNSILTKEFNED